MAERIADNADPAVDELKRRARRRLIGAIVLALAAAVILPLLLEKEPQPLGDDVSVQIPPIDEGHFVNRLTGRSADGKGTSKADIKGLPKSALPKVDAASATNAAPIIAAPPVPVTENAPAPPPASTNVAAPKKSVAEAEQRMLSPGIKPAAKVDAKAAPETKADTNVQMAVPTAVAAPPSADPVAPVVAASTEGFAVQLAAFTDDKGANALAGKLKRAGYTTTYTEPVDTSRGTLWRVRVGGFATRPDAEAARTKLKADGWNGLVVATK